MLSVCERDPSYYFCASYSIFMKFGMHVMPFLPTQTCEAGVTVLLHYGPAMVCWKYIFENF
jgi:hypothetical protein